jgi:hypothetical protein
MRPSGPHTKISRSARSGTSVRKPGASSRPRPTCSSRRHGSVDQVNDARAWRNERPRHSELAEPELRVRSRNQRCHAVTVTRETISRSRWPGPTRRVANVASLSTRSPAYPHEQTTCSFHTNVSMFATEDPGKQHRVTFTSRRSLRRHRLSPQRQATQNRSDRASVRPRPAVCRVTRQNGGSKASRRSRARARGRPCRAVAQTPSGGRWEAGGHAPLRVSPHHRSRRARRPGAGPMGLRGWSERRRNSCDYPMRIFAGGP